MGATPKGWHSIEAVVRCEKEHQFANVRGIQKVGEPGDALGIGLILHAGRAVWFESQFAEWDTIQPALKLALAKEAADNPRFISPETLEKGLTLFKAYVESWSKRLRPVNVAAEYNLGPSAIDGSSDETLERTARLDDVSRYPEDGSKLLWIGECKTSSVGAYDVVNQYELHGQPVLQYTLWKVAPQGEAMHGPVAGVMLDVVQKGYGGKPPTFSRHPLMFDKHLIEWFVPELIKKIRRQGEITWTGYAERNVHACTRMYGNRRVACPYRELCKHGKTATINYRMSNGDSLLAESSTIDGVRPWD